MSRLLHAALEQVKRNVNSSYKVMEPVHAFFSYQFSTSSTVEYTYWYVKASIWRVAVNLKRGDLLEQFSFSSFIPSPYTLT